MARAIGARPCARGRNSWSSTRFQSGHRRGRRGSSAVIHADLQGAAGSQQRDQHPSSERRAPVFFQRLRKRAAAVVHNASFLHVGRSGLGSGMA